MKAIAFLIFIGSFSLFIYMKFFIDDSRDGKKLQKIENNPRELRKFRSETIEFKKEINNVFEDYKNNGDN